MARPHQKRLQFKRVSKKKRDDGDDQEVPFANGIKGSEKKAKETIARYREPLSRGDSILAAIEAKQHDFAFTKGGNRRTRYSQDFDQGVQES